MATSYTSLDSAGYISSPTAIADRLLADYIASNYSQSNIFFGQIKSLAYTVRSNPNNTFNLCRQITNDLETVYNAYLDNVSVDVTAEQIDNTSVLEVTIVVQYLSNGLITTLAKSLQTDSTGTARIAELESR
jgi:hypothetical protein